ncbi:MAG: fructose-6-phosphate aldolase [Euryarchaeota archaeon]|nr:fructose-6-phosphate aldolase [Euryarchaeota archaeon]
MKIFLDTANVKEIKEAAAWGILDGVTTNPTLIMKEGRDYPSALKEICSIVDGPVSAETIAEDHEGMVREGVVFSKIHENIVVKVPMTAEGLKAVKRLEAKGIRTNTTLCFSPTQALLVAKAGGFIVSPFVGRLDDMSHNGMDLIRQILKIYGNYGYKTQVLVASVRHPIHVVEAAEAGAHIATLPWKVLEQMVKHPLTDRGIQQFLKDWEKVPKNP